MMPKRPNNDYRDHRGYYREDDDLTVTEGAIQRQQKDWSTYRKTDPFILISLAILIATLMGGGIAIGIHFATRGSPNSQVPTSDSHIVPRFAGINYNVHGFNGTLTHGINSTLSGLATTGTLTLCEDDADETITVTQFLGNNKTTSVDTTITTHVQKTLTQTLHKSPMGTTVSSADPVNTTLPGSSVVTQSIPVVTKVLTTSVTETAYHTATAHQSNAASESSESVIESTSSIDDAPPIVVTTVGPFPTESSHPEVTSVFLTKTLTQTRKTTIQGGPLVSTEEFSSTTTVTPTTIIKSTIYVTAAPLSSTTQAQCSHEVEDHTVYVTVTETFTPGAASSSSSVQYKTSKASSAKMSSSTASVSPSTATDTILVTYTVTIDSLYPPTTSPIMSSSSSSEMTSSTLGPASKSTIVVTQVATQTVIVSIGHGTTVSSQLGHAGTPLFTSLASSGSAQASTATDAVVLTKTITSNVFKTISASSSSSHSADIQTHTQTSIVTVTASPSSALSSKSSSSQSVESILTTIYLTDRATQTVTIGGMATVTIHPEQSSSTSSSLSGPFNSTRTETKTITASASRVVRTYTTTVSGQVFTSLITVWKNVTATATATLSSSGSTSSLTSISHEVQNTTVTATATSVVEVPVTLNTTITITGTPMMHPTAPSTLPPFVNGTAMTSSTRHVPTTYHYPTLSSSTATEQPKSTSTVVVVSGVANKHAEGIMGGCKGCTTWLAIFVLGLMVLF
ncbi:hypothetical protein CABS01_00296 [Colletotrichum abscissum]|uniref:Uncharacterized protein n=1 Tax=Colletotrichum abscissum TaxID=1671311 RepID=A0A9Q0B1H9_9PEZI|nr:uncharacterized protein CABS01_00296 [Colletotrichum abscissum]KAI3544175.1 hypothetical protein CABS02_09849 [Colletotrichum abscissum]KAK1525207.1 hypothetical protein CABS01_00296 [Colletotrichum abscissum]